MKRCSKCGIEKELTCYHKNKAQKDNLHNTCKVCRKAYHELNKEVISVKKKIKYENNKEKNLERNKEWRKNNPKYSNKYYEKNKEKMSVQAKKYYEENKEDLISKSTQWNKDNKDKTKEYQNNYRRKHANEISSYRQINKEYNKLWWKNNPEKHKIYKNNRKARKVNNGGTLASQEWLYLKKKYDYTCLCCHKKEPYIILTIDHIIPLIKGGSNSIDNIQPLCKVCNSKKNSKIIDYR